MSTARARGEVPLAPEPALRLWADVSRWPTFVEGFARVVEADPAWPAREARTVWESAPGRGRVSEKVVEVGPGLLAKMVFEERLVGRQTFHAEPSERGSAVVLRFEYGLTKYGPLAPVADALFVRRSVSSALRRTLFRFGVEAEEEAGLR